MGRRGGIAVERWWSRRLVVGAFMVDISHASCGAYAPQKGSSS